MIVSLTVFSGQIEKLCWPFFLVHFSRQIGINQGPVGFMTVTAFGSAGVMILRLNVKSFELLGNIDAVSCWLNFKSGQFKD